MPVTFKADGSSVISFAFLICRPRGPLAIQPSARKIPGRGQRVEGKGGDWRTAPQSNESISPGATSLPHSCTVRHSTLADVSSGNLQFRFFARHFSSVVYYTNTETANVMVSPILHISRNLTNRQLG
ncbi:hypothetical protein M413DRAFT_146519 [Hebeloma cylindrosporum]|uniref:Uncharacterized protein n=1 Tax=Hebeloma cylindrosporum TaxID=76867 RepID=A0A0C3BXK5_HEBCY|nr:hypothetical protein M413DRAFT_146519 [Hebeloma cylindrosporum h7]